MKDFFANCNTIDEAKRRYRALVKEHHPDLGGDPETMRAITEQYAAFSPNTKGSSPSDLTDAEIAQHMNANRSFVDPRVFREFQSRPNLTEWWDEDKGRYVIGTLEKYREYKSKPRPSKFERLFADAVARAD